MIENKTSRIRLNFWLAWVVANAIGLGFAWSLGELIGRQAAESFGWKTGQIIGIVVFEGFLWIVRAVVLLRIKSYDVLRPVEVLIWLSTEIFGWMVSEMPIQEESLMGITVGAIFATTLGAVAWIVFWFIKIPKARSSGSWGIQAFLWTFFGFIGGSVLITLIQTTSLVIGETLAKMYSPIIGMAVAGIIFGGLIGSITGLALVKLIHWKTSET